MGTLFVYIIKSAFCLMVLYLPYTLLLRHEQLHRINRVVLLAVVVFSFLLPSVPEGWLGGEVHSLQTAVPETTYALVLDGLQQSDAAFVEAEDGNEVPLWALLLVILYIIGVVVSLVVRAVQFVRMYRGITFGCLWKECRPSGAVLYCHAHEVPPFSWMRAIVMSEADLEDSEGQAILAHEEAHVRYGHSYDTLLVLAAEVLQWFNPVIWMLEADLRCIHEYQADNYVLDLGVDKKNYQLYLIKKAVGTRLQSFANGLNQSTLKNRIAMMSNKKSTKWAVCRVLYLLPMGALATVAFASPEITDRMDSVQVVKVMDSFLEVNAYVPKNVRIQKFKNAEGVAVSKWEMPRDTVYNQVEEFPKFPGGEEALWKFIAENMRYPKVCQDSGYQARVFIQFVVAKDGTLKDIHAIPGPGQKEVNPGKNPLHQVLIDEAIRVTKLMPAWTPGKMGGKAVNARFTYPVNFRLK